MINQVIPVNGVAPADQNGAADHAERMALVDRATRLGSARAATTPSRRGTEPYDAILWRLEARHAPESAKSTTLGLIGCERRVGVTTVAANLAVRASELQLGPVLLVETNATAPRLSKMWRLSAGPGLAQLLAGEASYADCVRPGPTPGLTVLPAGSLPRGATSSWEPGGVEALFAEACADHRLVVFDLPAADELQQALLLARQLDQVLLVVRSEATRQQRAERVADRLEEDGVPLSGAVLNRRRSYVPRWLERWI